MGVRPTHAPFYPYLESTQSLKTRVSDPGPSGVLWKPCQVSGTGLRTLLAPELPELALNEENPTGWWWAGASYPHSLQGTPNSDTSGTHTSGISEKRPHGQTIEHVRAPETLPDLPSLLARQEIGPVPQISGRLRAPPISVGSNSKWFSLIHWKI